MSFLTLASSTVPKQERPKMRMTNASLLSDGFAVMGCETRRSQTVPSFLFCYDTEKDAFGFLNDNPEQLHMLPMQEVSANHSIPAPSPI